MHAFLYICNVVYSGGVTALHEASQNGDKAAVEALVTARADVNQLDK